MKTEVKQVKTGWYDVTMQVSMEGQTSYFRVHVEARSKEDAIAKGKEKVYTYWDAEQGI